MYDTMDLIVPILIIAAIAVIILAFFKSMKEINDNKKAPLLSVPAKVAGKNLLSIIQYTIRYWKKRKGHCHSREQNLSLSSDRRFLDKCLIQAKAPGTAIPRAFFVCFYGTRTEAGCCYLFLSNHLQI